MLRHTNFAAVENSFLGPLLARKFLKAFLSFVWFVVVVVLRISD